MNVDQDVAIDSSQHIAIEMSEDMPSVEDEALEHEIAQEESHETVEQEEAIDVLMVGDEPVSEEKEPAPNWVKELRQNHRETVKRNRELEQKLAELTAPKVEAQATLPAKPTLESCDWDGDEYALKLDVWYQQKLKFDAEHQAKLKEAENQQREWQAKVEGYNTTKQSLTFKDFEEAEFNAQQKLSLAQQGILLQGSENPAIVVYALGKNPSKLDELSKITDPVKFAFAVSKLEAQMKVTKSSSKPAPEKVPTSGASSGAIDSQLDRLRAEAERTGDYSKVVAYKRNKQRS